MSNGDEACVESEGQVIWAPGTASLRFPATTRISSGSYPDGFRLVRLPEPLYEECGPGQPNLLFPRGYEPAIRCLLEQEGFHIHVAGQSITSLPPMQPCPWVGNYANYAVLAQMQLYERGII